MAKFSDVYKQELKSKGILSSIGSAAAKRLREKLDVRNMLFGGSGAIAATGQKIFGKGYQAIQKDTSKKLSDGTGVQSVAMDQLLVSAQRQETQLSIIAKNTMNSNAMARDINVMRQNIMKLVTMGGGKASRGADMFFKDAASRETAYESQFKKGTDTEGTTPTTEKSKSGGLLGLLAGMAAAIVGTIKSTLGGIPELLKNIFSISNIMKMFGIAGNVISGIAKLLPMLVSPVFLGIIAAVAGATWLMKWLDKKNDEANTQEKMDARVADDRGSPSSKLAARTILINPGLKENLAADKTDDDVARYTRGEIKTKDELAKAISSAEAAGKNSIEIKDSSVVAAAKDKQRSSNLSSPSKIPLLDAISKGESRGDYNAMNQGTVGIGGKVIGSGNSERIIEKKLTDMTIGEIMAKGAKKTDSADKRREQGLIFAAGRYQIVPDTLKGLVDSGIASKDEKFDEVVQDRLAMELVRRRGALKMASEGRYADAQNALAMEWAAIPLATDVVDKKGNIKKAGTSFYAGPGNKAHVGSGEDVAAALKGMDKDALTAMTHDQNVPASRSASGKVMQITPVQANVAPMPNPMTKTGTITQLNNWVAKYGATHNSDGTPKSSKNATTPVITTPNPVIAPGREHGGKVQQSMMLPATPSSGSALQQGSRALEENAREMSVPPAPNVTVNPPSAPAPVSSMGGGTITTASVMDDEFARRVLNYVGG
jgi:hypothetical protein